MQQFYKVYDLNLDRFLNSMMRKALLILLSLSFWGVSHAQITTVISGGASGAGSYGSFAAAITALNGSTITGAVTVNVTAGQTETLTSRVNIIATGTVSNTITIQKSGVGTNPILTSYVGTSATAGATIDGMVSISGGDYITIDGIDLTEASGNTTTTTVMEYGYGIFKASLSDGAQNNTIKNCVITLNRVQNVAWTVGHNGSTGIIISNTTSAAAGTALTPTVAAGANSGNKIYTNTIQNCNTGIVLIGFVTSTAPYSAGDFNNDIGGSSLATGNTVLNFGGGAATNPATGIFANNQWGLNVSYNTVNNNNGSGINHASTLRGIFLNSGAAGASATCNNNSITIKGGGTTSQLTGIENGFGGLTPLSNTINLNNNSITGQYLTATTGVFYGIYSNGSQPTTLNIEGNTVQNINYSTVSLVGSGVLYGIFVAGTPATNATFHNIRNNNINNIARFGTTGGTTIGIFNNSSNTLVTHNVRLNTINGLSIDGTGTTSTMYGIQTTTGTVRCDSNTVYNLSCIKTTGTGVMYGIYNIASPTNETFNNNTIYNLTHSGTGTTYGLFTNTFGGVRTVARNLIYAISTGGTTVAGMLMTASTPTVFSNKIFNIQSTSSGVPTVSGLIVSSVSATGATIYNNVIGDIKAPNASYSTEAALVRGINLTIITASTNVLLYYNTVYLNASSTGVNFSSAALFVTGSATATSANLDMRNNIFYNVSTPGSTAGFSVAYRRSSGLANLLANYASTSNNNLFYAGTPGAQNLIYYDGTSLGQSITDYKSGVFTAGTIAPRDANSVSESLTFLSTTGSSSQFLELNGSFATQAESGAAAITGYTDTYNATGVRIGYPLGGQTNGGGTAPDIGAYEGDYTPSDQTGPIISYTSLSNTSSTSNRVLTVSISDASGVPTAGAGLPVLYWKINAGSYSAITGSYVSGTNYTFTFGSGVIAADVISYYIVAQDNAAANNLSVLPSTGASGLSFNPPAASTAPSSASTYTILGTIFGSFEIGATKTSPNYTSLTAAMADINVKELVGAVVLNLDSDYDPTLETFPISFTNNPGASSNNTLTVKPKSGVTGIITGSLASSALIKLNGADYVIIDGSNNGTTSKDLTITNTSVTAPTVIHIASLGLAAGATFNTIKNCNLSTGINATVGYGIAVSGATPGTNGDDNDNTTIQNNSISVAAVPIFAIGNSLISAGALDNLSILDNSIDFSITIAGGIGIRVGNALSSTIRGNTINIETSTTLIAGISLETGFTNSTVSKNLITKVYSSHPTGSSIARGISIGTGNATSNLIISNNVIYNVLTIAPSSTVGYGHAGIMIGSIGSSTTVTTIAGGISLYYNSVNLFGNANRSIASVNYAVYFGSNASAIDCRNNIFANSTVNINAGATLAKSYAIYSVTTNAAYTTLNYNDYYASGTQGTLGFLAGAKATLLDWQTASAQDVNSIVTDPTYNSNTNLIPLTGAPVLATGTGVSITEDYLGTARSVATPSMGAYENGVDLAAPSISFTGLSNAVVGASRTITNFATITDGSGINTSSLTKPRFYYKKSTDNNAYVGNTNSDNGWKYVEASNSISPFSFVVDYTLINGGSVAGADVIQYFVVAQDLASTPNVGLAKTGLGFAVSPSSVALGSGQFPLTGTPDQYTIVSALPTTINVGTSETYTSLSGVGGLFEAINAAVLGGNTTISITSDLAESGAVILQNAGLGGYTLTIQPSSGSVYNIVNSADIAANGMICIFGNNVTIDGRFSGSGRYLRFQNTHSTALSAQAAIYVNDCSGFTLRNCTVQGNTSGTGNGVILIGSGSNLAVTNVSILGNIIQEPTTGLYLTRPTIGIYMKSTACGSVAIGDAVDGNEIINCTTYGIWVGGNVGASIIRNNKIYQTAAISATYYGVYANAGTSLTIRDNHFYVTIGDISGIWAGIYLTSSTLNNMTIQGNYVGGRDINCGGSALNITGASASYGIYMSMGTTSNSVQSNTVQNFTIPSTGVFYGIYTLGTTNVNIGTITGNTVGHTSTPNSITRLGASGVTYGIFSAATGGVTIQNNLVANLSSTAATTSSNLGGIYYSGAGQSDVSSNTVRDLSTVSTSSANTGLCSVFGISVASASASFSNNVNNNLIYNIANNNTTSTTSNVGGLIIASANYYGNVNNNKIYGLINKTTGAGFIQGLYIYDVSSSTATIIANNQIAINNKESGVDVSNSICSLYGIREAGATAEIPSFLYNSVYVGGSCLSSATTSSAAINIFLSQTATYKNNIFYNERNGGTGTLGQGHFAFAYDISTAGGTFTNNLFLTPSTTRVGRHGGTAELNVFDFAGFNTAASQTSSVSGSTTNNPSASFFTNVDTANLVTTNCKADNAGTVVSVTTDYSGTTRSVSTPDIGSTEFASTIIEWLGGTTNWSTASNWCLNAVPSSSSPVVIPSVTNNPVLSGATAIGNINILSGALVDLNSLALTLNGALSGSGNIKGNGSLVVSGAGSGTLNMDQTTPGTSNKLTNLTYSGNLTLGNALQITGIVTPTAGTLATGGNLTLVSTATTDGSIATGTGSYLTGNVTVQRFIPGSTGRKYRYLAAPFSAGPSIANGWQQQVHITGSGAGGTNCPTLTPHTNGFDASTYNNASMMVFNEATATPSLSTPSVSGGTVYTNAWTGVASTNATNLNAGVGYNMFIRGTRAQGCALLDGTNPTPNDVVLSATGTVTTGTFPFAVTYNAANGDGWNMVGNPYPSAIDWNASGWTRTNVQNTVWIFRPSNDLISTYNGTTGVNGGDQIIASGQAFFVKATAGSPALSVTESVKTSSFPGVLLMKNKPFELRLTLRNSGLKSDETVIALDQPDKTNLYDMDFDAEKMNNPSNVNIYSIDGMKKKYAINAIAKLEDGTEYTLPLGIGAPALGAYSISFTPNSLPYYYQVFLRDHYLQTEKQIETDKGLSYAFAVNSDSASFGNTRFDVFIRNLRPHSTGLNGTGSSQLELSVYPNPTNDMLHIDVKSNQGAKVTSLVLINSVGQVIGKLNNPSGNNQFDLSEFAPGVYILQAFNGVEVLKTFKVIKK